MRLNIVQLFKPVKGCLRELGFVVVLDVLTLLMQKVVLTMNAIF